jgi:hypothetical protein
MLRTTRTVAVAAALASTVALAGAASASAATSISGLPASAPIVNRLYVPMALSVACDGDPWGFPSSASVSVTLRQVVSGKNIAHGTASVGSLTCDGAPHDYTVSVFPDGVGMFTGTNESPLFAKGDAVVSAQMNSIFTASSAMLGPQTIKLTK